MKCDRSQTDELFFCYLEKDQVFAHYEDDFAQMSATYAPLTEGAFFTLWRNCFPYVLLKSGDEV